MRVLVTGAAGRIGAAAAEALLKAGHFVRGFDRVASKAASESVVGDIADAKAVLEAARGVEAIVHLAATPDDADFMTALLGPNIVGVYNILEAARLNGVKRVALASTGQINMRAQWTGPLPIRTTDPVTPLYWYAVTKIFAEHAGQVYAATHGMDVVAVRLGACPRDRAFLEQFESGKLSLDVYLSPGDAGRFFLKAVEARAGFGFQVVFVLSKWIEKQVFDLEPARRLFGWEPQDRWPEGLPEL